MNTLVPSLIKSLVPSLVTPDVLEKYSIITDTNGRWLADTNGRILLIRR